MSTPNSPPYGYYPYPPPRPANVMAVAAMVLGNMWMYCVGSMVHDWWGE